MRTESSEVEYSRVGNSMVTGVQIKLCDVLVYHHIISYHIISYHFISCHVMLSISGQLDAIFAVDRTSIMARETFLRTAEYYS
jgi:hypothetical protein